MALLDLQALQVPGNCDGHFGDGHSRGRDCGSGLSLLLCG